MLAAQAVIAFVFTNSCLYVIHFHVFSFIAKFEKKIAHKADGDDFFSIIVTGG